MEKVCQFIKDAGVYYIATTEGDQPRVRPFGTVNIFDGKLYIQTGKKKAVSHQIAQNPRVELCAFKDGVTLRLCGTLVEDERLEAQQSLLDAYPELGDMYAAGDGNNVVYYFTDATATFSSFTAAPEVIRF